MAIKRTKRNAAAALAATRQVTREDQRSSKPSKRASLAKAAAKRAGKDSGAGTSRSKKEKRRALLLRRRYPPKKELKLEDLEGVRTLGEGGFGAVCLARIKNKEQDEGGQFFAVKVQQKKTLVISRHQRTILSERKFLMNLPWSPFVAGILDTFQDERNAYYVLELMGFTTLHSARYRYTKGRILETDAMFYLSNIVLGVEHLHKHGIVHCDLKPNNIILCDDGYLAIADLGLAKEVSWKSSWDSFGSPEYMPPETFDKSFGPLGKALDWWSVGCILYEMVAGERAFYDHNRSSKELRSRIASRSVGAHGPWKGASGYFYDLLYGLLETDPTLRWGAKGSDKIRTCEWFVDLISWAEVEARTIRPPRVPVSESRAPWREPHKENVLNQELVPGLAIKEPPVALMYIGKHMPAR